MCRCENCDQDELDYVLYAQGFGYCKKAYTFQQSHLDKNLLNFTPFDIISDFKKLNKKDAL